MDTSEEHDEPTCLINPEIIEEDGHETAEEGCLSFPGVYAKVKRAAKIKVRFFDENGEQHERMAENLESRCIQHEIDHLNGKVFIDNLSRLKKSMLVKKLEKIHKTTF